MLLCLDIGNTHLFGGIFKDEKLILRFRYATHLIGTSDQFGIFLINLLQVNHIERDQIRAVAVCSVVPGCDYTVQHTFLRYFKTSYFDLKAGVKTGLNIKIKHPNEVGADRIANAIGATHVFPNNNLIIADLGTATTVCAVNSKRDYMGGAILPGLKLGMESLKSSTAKLTEVSIESPADYIGRTTKESIQRGLYFGTLGALREIINGFKKEFGDDQQKEAKVIGTGGFAYLYREKKIFDHIMPDLVLTGLAKAYILSEFG
jgi:type III pantothenate kinase